MGFICTIFILNRNIPNRCIYLCNVLIYFNQYYIEPNVIYFTKQGNNLMAKDVMTTESYINHHLTNLTCGKTPDGWTCDPYKVDQMSFWAFHVDSLFNLS